jgi:hypothetical protein
MVDNDAPKAIETDDYQELPANAGSSRAICDRVAVDGGLVGN